MDPLPCWNRLNHFIATFPDVFKKILRDIPSKDVRRWLIEYEERRELLIRKIHSNAYELVLTLLRQAVKTFTYAMVLLGSYTLLILLLVHLYVSKGMGTLYQHETLARWTFRGLLSCLVFPCSHYVWFVRELLRELDESSTHYQKSYEPSPLGYARSSPLLRLN